MKKIKHLIGTATLFMLPVVASAQLAADGGDGGQFQDLVTNIVDLVNTVLIPFVIAIGFLAFVWGMFQYFIAGGANEESKEKGKSLMIWATVGFVFIIIFWGVINLIATSIGLEDDVIVAPNTITIP